jgi:hypothetical protein
MRIWLGIEQEFGKKVETLYIEEEKNFNVDTILSLAQKHKVSSLYFGAGEQDITDYSFFKKLSSQQYKFFVETSNLDTIPNYVLKLVTVILRTTINSKKRSFSPIIKIRSLHYVYTIPLDSMRCTSLITDNNFNPSTKTYIDDVILYDDSSNQGESVCPS